MEIYRVGSAGRIVNGNCKPVTVGRMASGRAEPGGPVLHGYGLTDHDAVSDLLDIGQARERDADSLMVELFFRGRLDPA